MKKLFNNILVIVAIAVAITFFSTRALYKNFKNEEIYNLQSAPNGIVTSVIGLTSTYDSLMFVPLEYRFHSFEVSIFNPETKDFYLIVVPFHVVRAFQIGLPSPNGNEEYFKKYSPNIDNRIESEYKSNYI